MAHERLDVCTCTCTVVGGIVAVLGKYSFSFLCFFLRSLIACSSHEILNITSANAPIGIHMCTRRPLDTTT